MLDNDMKEKLLNASSLVEVKEIVKDCSELNPEKVWEEVEMRRSGKNEKLDLEELDAVSGGKWDRDWVRDGCAATREYNSWCGSNDFCYAFDVTYDHFWAKCPDGHDHVFEKAHASAAVSSNKTATPGCPDNLEKMARLLQMLDVLFASPWNDKLVLEDGTAINLFYAGLPRLSVDIELDYCGASKEETVKDKAAIAEFVSGALLPFGYRLSDAGKTHYALDCRFLETLSANYGSLRDIIRGNLMHRRGDACKIICGFCLTRTQ